MDLHTLEKATDIIFRLCNNHPELCPHEWEFSSSQVTFPNGEYEEGKRINTYTCNICGNTYIEEDSTIEPPRYIKTDIQTDGTPTSPCPYCGAPQYIDRFSQRGYTPVKYICRSCNHEELKE